MKRLVFAVLAVLAVGIFIGCASQPAATPEKPAEVPQKGPNYVVVDHKTMALGGTIPEWLEVYMNGGGLSDIEALPKYKDFYCFVAEDNGTNLNALKQWATGFSVTQEIARMVSTRVQARFAGAAAGSPDDEYGRYFENVVKAASDASYSGARKEADFWVLKRYFKPDGKTVDREVYDYYVLVVINKDTLKQQIDAVLNGVKPDKPLTKEQQTAVDRVKQAFYEGF
ncbi:MAG TPA: hypothetical protein PLW34_08775 [Termitinemataceae bacterium]|uniref:hypothetical protein n=1 Tax=Treponema sp. J25 TaxID=2094121 RepID=UPI00104BC207|nr:hypothetical protein [Treponema sp. J25]TCW60995.1 hypothetical protein C5O22_08640 [Treponema sp. J25]HOJ99641.1 hypothetical protein [Termitinemataceae bacterium]HOM24199.1 hypothetical protein [Termitinemataceae bacterium]HPQ01236.1 hypothetical protein [Termitinemataceae bacterium]